MAYIPPHFLNTVVAVGTGDDPENLSWIGTGFLYGEFLEKSVERKQSAYQVWLVANKHVLDGFKGIYIKFNSSQNLESKNYYVPLLFKNGRPRWVGHINERIDVAVIWLNPDFLQREQRKFNLFKSDQDIFKKADMISSGISEGDNIFVLGFPMGLVSTIQQYVICRGGNIARIRDYIDGLSTSFIVDAPVFPGNSGGPVILCPSIYAINGTKPIKQSVLLGIVKAYIPYRDVAISGQTNQPRISFEENSGLAIIESVDSIIETIDRATKRIAQRKARKTQRRN